MGFKKVVFFSNLAILALMLACIVACSAGNFSPQHNHAEGSEASQGAYAPYGSGAVSPVTLCLSRDDNDISGSIIIRDLISAVHDADATANVGSELACDSQALQTGEPIELFRDQPYEVFFVRSVDNMQYCLQVTRSAGYVTLSHEVGEVHRDGDVFTWCFVNESQSEENLLIRSLTPRAAVTLPME